MEKNIAFIDGQNLHLGTNSENWQVDFERFRIYLRDKFKIKEAYIFLGFVNNKNQKLYTKLHNSGFLIIFREHHLDMKGKKKGNVDVDICFEIMKNIVDNDNFDKIVLVSGDGDYIKVVKYLIQKGIFKKILFPNKRYSSLYKPIKDKYGMNLGQDRVKNLIKYKK